MTIEDITRIFPDRALALYRVERGPANERRMVWAAQWHTGYFTSDTDRHAGYEPRESYPVCGDTVEKTLGALVQDEIRKLRANVDHTEAAAAEWRAKLDELLRRVGGEQ